MTTFIIGIIFIVIGLIFFAIFCCQYKNIKQINQQTEEENKKIEKTNTKLKEELIYLQNEKKNIQKQSEELLNQNENLDKYLIERKEQLDTSLEQMKENVNKAFEKYCDELDEKYNNEEDTYAYAMKRMNEEYDSFQDRILSARASVQADLDAIKATRAAALQAIKREEEIKQKLSFYCLQISEADKEDIKKLESIKSSLHNPRILSMLIWSTYFQKPMTTLCNNILGVNTVCGIYKITNQKNNMCYIGQSTDVSKRLKEHAKCGLGIDTPVGNKLYKAMIQDGLWNFSFELLEKCSKDKLNEEERKFIALYQSKDYGYNTVKGVSE